MILIIISIVMGYIGANIGGMIADNELFIYLFMIVGILSPSMYVLEKIYKELKSK